MGFYSQKAFNESATEEEKEAFKKDTQKHIDNVSKNIDIIINELNKRKAHHDESKFKEPELSVYAEYGPKLKAAKYGTPEYQELLKGMKIALDHHYKNNTNHHPDSLDNGISDMDLVDVIEMLCDWNASAHANDNDVKFDINQKRFNMSDDLTSILKSTSSKYLRNK